MLVPFKMSMQRWSHDAALDKISMRICLPRSVHSCRAPKCGMCKTKEYIQPRKMAEHVRTCHGDENVHRAAMNEYKRLDPYSPVRWTPNGN